MWNDAKLLTESENNILLAHISTSRQSSHRVLLARFQSNGNWRKGLLSFAYWQNLWGFFFPVGVHLAPKRVLSNNVYQLILAVISVTNYELCEDNSCLFYW